MSDDLSRLKEKLTDWKSRLGHSDLHSIGSQIGRLLWRSAFYRSLNESRRFLPDDDDGGKQGNAALHELLDDGFLVLNAIAVRRLLDKGAIRGPRGVYSLYGLIKDIAESAGLVMRRNVLQARGLEYDFEPVKRRAYEIAWRAGSPVYCVSMDGWAESETWHRLMDALSGVAEEHRSPDDAADARKLDRLLQDLERHGSNVQNWVDKFVAHAASPESRQTLQPGYQDVSLAKLWLAERVVVCAASFISHYFIEGMKLRGIPIPHFDQFAYIERPFTVPAALEAMRHAWDRHRSEIHSCEDWFWDNPLADGSDVWNDDGS